MLSVLLGLFTFYHTCLLFFNQTTNERYKLAEIPDNCPPIPSQNNATPSVQHSSQDYNTNTEDCHRKLINKTKDSESSKLPGKIVKSHFNQISSHRHADNNSNICQKQELDLSSFYNKGLILNIREVFLPWYEFNKVVKRSTNNNNNNKSAFVIKKKMK